MLTKHLLIKGKVQGVFYRASAKEVAQELKLKGWIKNTDEGHVEAVITGPADALQQFIGWCRKGPSKARVDDVIVSEYEDQEFDHFQIIRD